MERPSGENQPNQPVECEREKSVDLIPAPGVGEAGALGEEANMRLGGDLGAELGDEDSAMLGDLGVASGASDGDIVEREGNAGGAGAPEDQCEGTRPVVADGHISDDGDRSGEEGVGGDEDGDGIGSVSADSDGDASVADGVSVDAEDGGGAEGSAAVEGSGGESGSDVEVVLVVAREGENREMDEGTKDAGESAEGSEAEGSEPARKKARTTTEPVVRSGLAPGRVMQTAAMSTGGQAPSYHRSSWYRASRKTNGGVRLSASNKHYPLRMVHDRRTFEGRLQYQVGFMNGDLWWNERHHLIEDGNRNLVEGIDKWLTETNRSMPLSVGGVVPRRGSSS